MPRWLTILLSVGIPTIIALIAIVAVVASMDSPQLAQYITNNAKCPYCGGWFDVDTNGATSEQLDCVTKACPHCSGCNTVTGFMNYARNGRR